MGDLNPLANPNNVLPVEQRDNKILSATPLGCEQPDLDPTSLPFLRRIAHTGIPQYILGFALDPSEMRVDGLSNLGHCMGVRSILEANSKVQMSDAFNMAILMHDVSQRRAGRSEKVFELLRFEEFSPQFIDGFFQLINKAEVGDAQGDSAVGSNTSLIKELVPALAYVESAKMFEVAGESWRSELEAYCLDQDVQVQEGSQAEVAFLEIQLKDALQRTGSNKQVDELKIEIVNALRSGNSPVSPEMRAFRAPVADVDDMLTTLGEYDLEGLLIKSAEVTHNLSLGHRNVNRPASSWRDAQELLSFYGPLLELAGFDSLATEAYSCAYEYLFEGTKVKDGIDVMTCARELHNRAARYWDQNSDALLLRFSEIPNINVYSARVKTQGSIAEKMFRHNSAHPKTPSIHSGLAYPADVIGIRVEIPDTPLGRNEGDYLNEQILRIVEMVEGYPDLGWNLGHTTQAEQVEIRSEGNEFIANRSHYLDRGVGKTPVDLSIRTMTLDGYTGVHISFIIDDNLSFGDQIIDPSLPSRPLGVEVQLHTSQSRVGAETTAAHVFYKLDDGFGPTAVLKRTLRRAKSGLDDLLHARQGQPQQNQPGQGGEENDFASMLNKYIMLRDQFAREKDRIMKRAGAIRTRKTSFDQNTDVNPITPGSMDHLLRTYGQKLKEAGLYEMVIKAGLDAKLPDLTEL